MVKKDFKAWANSRIKKLECLDMQLIKLSVFGFTLMLAKLWEPILSLSWYWYALMFLVAAIIPMNKFLRQ